MNEVPIPSTPNPEALSPTEAHTEAPTPASVTAPTPASVTAPTPASLKPVARAAISQASQWGRVTSDGTVFLKAPEGEVEVGQYAAGSPQDGLTFYARKYDDLVVEIEVIQTRIKESKTSADAAALVVKRVREALSGRSFVGDIVFLEQMCADVDVLIDQKRVTERARKAALKESARTARVTLVEEAEKMSGSSSWKSTTERYSAIVEEWKTLPRVDRNAEQEMWKRLSNARTTFDKRRRAHFHELDAERKEALSVKRELITRAQAALGTTDPKAGIKKFKDLMDAWKKAPRGSRADEDKLWKRFKAAQDEFFDTLKASEAAEEEKLRPNVSVKEELIVKAEALLPVDLTALKTQKFQLRELQLAWEKAGELPKKDRARLDSRLKKVEDAFRTVEEKQWTRTNPQALARAEDTANAFAGGLSKYERQLEQAKAAGDTKTTAQLEDSINSLRALLGAVENTAADLSS
ncbi:MAG: DUF349 domain-containing protein [Actinobacteria bacterium]|nr:DUF349 domain-containing protein [Actinomycetota bacterium]MDA9227213.1 DUF349 domain-containing protein [Actinomycetota bacterium]